MDALGVDVDSLRTDIGELHSEREVIATRLDGLERLAQTIEPWVGPEGQLRVRLERTEQAFLALLEDLAYNPASAADRARQILTTIPTPQA